MYVYICIYIYIYIERERDLPVVIMVIMLGLKRAIRDPRTKRSCVRSAASRRPAITANFRNNNIQIWSLGQTNS